MKFRADGVKRVMRELTSPATNKRIGKLVIDEMKDSLKAGVSPVRGTRRFQRYKNPEKYPGNRKPKLPVNLKLSGKMLAALTFWFNGTRLWVGIKDRKQRVKAVAHNEGTTHLPMRHFMPTNKGDKFTVTIERKIRNLYGELLADIIKKNRRK